MVHHSLEKCLSYYSNASSVQRGFHAFLDTGDRTTSCSFHHHDGLGSICCIKKQPLLLLLHMQSLTLVLCECRSTGRASRGGGSPTSDLEALALSPTMTTGRARFAMRYTLESALCGAHSHLSTSSLGDTLI